MTGKKPATDVPVTVTNACDRFVLARKLAGPWTLTKLAGDASNRTYFRLRHGTNTYVVMQLAQGFNSPAEEFTKTSRPVAELPFLDVQRYLKNRRVRVPEIHAADAACGVVILEDFGDCLLVSALSSASEKETEQWYQAALNQLERLAIVHPDDARNSIAFARSFDRELYNWEFEHFIEYGLNRRLNVPSKEREPIARELRSLTEEFLRWSCVFCHRDFHSRNLLLLEKFPVQLGVIDFQDALLAPLFYDLASLLRDSYVKLSSALQDRLVETYRLQMAPHNFSQCGSRDEFRRAFDFMGLHRNLKAAGRFCYIDDVKKNPAYLGDMPRTLSYVKDTLENYTELRELRVRLLPLLDSLEGVCAP